VARLCTSYIAALREKNIARRGKERKGYKSLVGSCLEFIVYWGNSMKIARPLLLACSLIVVILHGLAALHPTHASWGFHIFGFFGPLFPIAALAVALLFAVPSSHSLVMRWLERIFRTLSKAPLPLLVFGLSAAIIVLGALFSARLHLLGDGALLLRSLSNSDWGANIMKSFNNQPLMYWLFRTALNLHLIDSPASTYDLYVWINRLAALLMIGSIVWCMRQTPAALTEKVLIGSFLFFGAGCQFFFGYVENYVLQYVGTAIFVITGWMALERRISPVVPVITFGVIVGLHLGNGIYAPSLILLLLLYYKKSRKTTVGILAGLGIAGLAAIYLLGYMPALLRHFSSDSVDFLHPFSVPTGNFPYAMFSLDHLLDWANLNLLIAPLGLLAALVLLLERSVREQVRHPAPLFLLSTAICGLAFTWIVNAALGMARDWDLLSGFFVPLMVFDVYLLARAEFASPSRHVIAVVAAVTMLHTVGWIGVNASEDRHLARARLLNDGRFLSPTSQLFFDESLANLFYDTGQYPDARVLYEHYISIDPNNPRIIGNISDVYRKLGEKEKYFQMLLRAVEMKSTDPGIYSNLGVEYASRGDTNLAISFNERAVAIDPRQEKAHANLGLLYVSKRNYPLARDHFFTAIDLGMNDQIVLKYAADISFYLNDARNAVKYYDMYLRLKPDDQKARSLRDRARQLPAP